MQTHAPIPTAVQPTFGVRSLRRATTLAVALGLAGIAGATIPTPLLASPERAARGCSLATLKGRYLFADSGTVLPPAFGQTQPTFGADAGFHIFNGDGTGTDVVTVRIGDTVLLENAVFPISYTVNADCTGTYEVQGGPSFGLFIAADGDEFAAIATGPAGNYPAGIHPRVSHRR